VRHIKDVLVRSTPGPVHFAKFTACGYSKERCVYEAMKCFSQAYERGISIWMTYHGFARILSVCRTEAQTLEDTRAGSFRPFRR
jgi:hypothetical protein